MESNVSKDCHLGTGIIATRKVKPFVANARVEA